MKYACTCESADSCVLHPPGTRGGPPLPLPTGSRIARYTETWSQLAQEAIEVEIVGITIYGFGSELAVLRLHYKLGVGRVAYSSNLKRWYYTPDTEGNPR